MKPIALVIGAVVLIAFALPAFAGGPAPANASVMCIGKICKGSGTLDYEYQISDSSVDISVFKITTCDPDPSHYSDWLQPEGWIPSIQPISGQHNPEFVDHGVPTTPDGNCVWSIVWENETGSDITSGLFGFNNSRAPHEASWDVNGGMIVSNWESAVGEGAGPVHSPVPEPVSLVSLGSGLFGLAGYIIRRRYR